MSCAIVQPGVPEEFVRAEREEDEVWQAQLDLGGEIDAGIQHVLQLQWQETFNANTVGALSFSFCSVLTTSVWSPLMSSICSS